MRSAAGLILAGALILGCAQIEAPRGGPEDKETPRVIGTFPDSGAVGVPALDSLVILFSEPMDRRTVEDAFFFSPPLEYREKRWEKQSWILRLRDPLRPGQTYVGLLGTAARDRHGLGPKVPWSFAFSTGESLDTGAVSGHVFGQRYPPKGAFLYVWPWDSGPPDTTREGYPPDPLRLGQADAQGAYELRYLPRNRALLICALYDRQGDQRFDPSLDRWACGESALVIGDTVQAIQGVDLFLAFSDEPGTVGGEVVDSLCLRSPALQDLVRSRAARDSLLSWKREQRGMEGAGLSVDDSLRIDRELLRLDSLAAPAAAESADCAQPIIVQLLTTDSTLVREAQGPAAFRWTDVPPGTYRLQAFRDLNADGRRDPGEPDGRYQELLEVRPLRVREKLNMLLPRQWRKQPS